ALDDGVVEPFDDLETGRGFDRRRLADRTKGVSDLADISRTQLETQRGIDAHRIQEFAAYELDAGNVGLGRTDVLLDQGDAVDGRFKLITVHVGFQRLDIVEELDAQALARTVVLGDERTRHLPRSIDDLRLSDGSDGSGGLDPVVRQRRILRHLADF